MGSVTSQLRYVAFALLLSCQPSASRPPLHGPVEVEVETVKPRPGPPSLVGSRIVALANGVLIIDADSGQLIRVDSADHVTARLQVGRDAGQLAYDPARNIAFVADRRGDRIVVVDVARMQVRVAWKTPAEPFGVAITPDRATVLVTTIADRTLVAYDAIAGRERWRTPLFPEPRAVAISPDGSSALISSIATGTLAHVALTGAHRVRSIAFEQNCSVCKAGDVVTRGTGTVMFLDAKRAVATFQRVVPESKFARPTTYGGASFVPPVTHHVAFLGFAPDGTARQVVAQIADHQPRTLGWDPDWDTLYILGLGSDSVLRLPKLTASTTAQLTANISAHTLRTTNRCGPDGIAIGESDGVLIWCSFSRSLLRIRRDPAHNPTGRQSAGLTPTSWTPQQHFGHKLFHVNSLAVNARGSLACSSCHPEGRTDGLSWLIQGNRYQTPVLAGRVTGTAPYKWDGSDATLEQSIATTTSRLSGRGFDAAQLAALGAYLRALPPLRTPTRDRAAVARGQQVFKTAGCSHCHTGSAYTDNDLHEFTAVEFTSILPRANTPSLVGLHASAPYYHDGSAKTLAALLAGHGSVLNMADFSVLTAAQRTDLQAFLETR